MKAIVVVSADTPKQHLRELADKGAVGCRVNTLFPSNAQLDDVKLLARSIADFGWHLQMLVDVSEIDDLVSLVTDLLVPVVFDHMGHVPALKGVDDPGFQSLLRLLGDGLAWAKISGAYRTTAGQGPAYPDVRPFADALIRTNAEHLVWGCDWPHPDIATPMPNDGDLLNQLADWVLDEATLKAILVTNPERLYGFA
jgi:predicted TIM-barrel fold metal-dependent hydrolase